jgi:hypothetical protein
MVTGVTTEAIAGEKMIVTAGGVDTHVHYICPQLLPEALASGVTTLYGGGTGPASGTCATTCTPAPDQLKMMLQATDCFPMNIGLSGKGNTSTPEGMHEALAAGAAGFKLHEDWGTTLVRVRGTTLVRVGVGGGVRLRLRLRLTLTLTLTLTITRYDARCDRRVPRLRRRARRGGDHPHGHAQRVWLRAGLARGDQGAYHPHLPLGGRGGWPRARHHQGVRV